MGKRRWKKCKTNIGVSVICPDCGKTQHMSNLKKPNKLGGDDN